MLTARPEDKTRDALLDRAAALDAAVAAALEIARASQEEAPEGASSDAPPSASPADIWRAAAIGDRASLSRVVAAARARPSVAAAFSRALDASAQATFRPLRAAADGAVSRRVAGGYAIELRRSAQRPGRCFVVVTTPAGAPEPSTLVWRRSEAADADAAAFGALALGPTVAGVAQTALDSADPAVAAIADRAATLHLR